MGTANQYFNGTNISRDIHEFTVRIYKEIYIYEGLREQGDFRREDFRTKSKEFMLYFHVNVYYHVLLNIAKLNIKIFSICAALSWIPCQSPVSQSPKSTYIYGQKQIALKFLSLLMAALLQIMNPILKVHFKGSK